MKSSNVSLFPSRAFYHSMTPPNFMVIGLQIGKLHIGAESGPPSGPYEIPKSPACLGLNHILTSPDYLLDCLNIKN